METDKKQDSSDASGTRLAAPKSSSRRRLLQAGLGATPAILTIVSGPVRAATLPCRSASAFASVAANGVTASTNPAQSCSGIQPSGWALIPVASWPASTFTTPPAGPSVALQFSSVFSPGVSVGANISPTLKDVLDSTESGLLMARYFVAAYLNIKSGRTPEQVVTELQLKAMWPLALGGTYTPIVGGTAWTWATLQAWFDQTMPSATA